MTSWQDTPAYRIYWALTSVKLTVVLLAIILVILIWGTIFEADRGTKAAQFMVYNSRWFDALLTLFGLNLLCCTIRHYHGERHQIGFLTTHAGIIAILIGGLVSRNYGQEGQLIIPEGEARDYIILPDNALAVSTLIGGERVTRQYDTAYDRLGGRTEVSSHFRFPREDLAAAEDLDIFVDRYYPDARFAEVLTDDSPELNPAIELRAIAWGLEQQAILQSRRPARSRAVLETAVVSFEEVADPEVLDELIAAAGPATTDRLGQLQLTFADGTRLELPLDGNLERPHELRGGPYTVRMAAFYPDFAVKHDHYTSTSSRLENPAVMVDVSGPDDATERHLIFALYPDMSIVHRPGEKELVTEARYDVAEEAIDATGSVRIIRAADGTLHAIYGAPGAASRAQRIEIDQPISYREAGLEFWVERSLDHGRLERQVWNASPEELLPALHVQLALGADRTSGWVVRGEEQRFTIGGRELQLSYDSKRLPLGFSVALEDFREITYPGISMAQSYESDVVVDATSASFARRISMNNPLKFGGFKIFQSSFQRGAREISIFSVSSDPGVTVVYSGCFVLVLGLILIFFLKPYLKRPALDGGGSSPSLAMPGAGPRRRR